MRLTKKNNGYHFPKKYEMNKNVSKHQVIHKLGSYEDSGYTPEELLLCSNPPEVYMLLKKEKDSRKKFPRFTHWLGCP